MNVLYAKVVFGYLLNIFTYVSLFWHWKSVHSIINHKTFTCSIWPFRTIDATFQAWRQQWCTNATSARRRLQLTPVWTVAIWLPIPSPGTFSTGTHLTHLHRLHILFNLFIHSFIFLHFNYAHSRQRSPLLNFLRFLHTISGTQSLKEPRYDV